MGIEGEWDNPKYKGIRKHFNSQTIRGRSNWGKAVLSFYAVLFVTYKTIRYMRRKPLEEAPKMVTNSVLATTVPSPCPENITTPHPQAQPELQPHFQPGQAFPAPGWYPYYFCGPPQIPTNQLPGMTPGPTSCQPPIYFYYPPAPPPGIAACPGDQKEITYASPEGKKTEETVEEHCSDCCSNKD